MKLIHFIVFCFLIAKSFSSLVLDANNSEQFSSETKEENDEVAENYSFGHQKGENQFLKPEESNKNNDEDESLINPEELHLLHHTENLEGPSQSGHTLDFDGSSYVSVLDRNQHTNWNVNPTLNLAKNDYVPVKSHTLEQSKEHWDSADVNARKEPDLKNSHDQTYLETPLHWNPQAHYSSRSEKSPSESPAANPRPVPKHPTEANRTNKNHYSAKDPKAEQAGPKQYSALNQGEPSLENNADPLKEILPPVLTEKRRLGDDDVKPTESSPTTGKQSELNVQIFKIPNTYFFGKGNPYQSQNDEQISVIKLKGRNYLIVPQKSWNALLNAHHFPMQSHMNPYESSSFNPFSLSWNPFANLVQNLSPSYNPSYFDNYLKAKSPVYKPKTSSDSYSTRRVSKPSTSSKSSLHSRRPSTSKTSTSSKSMPPYLSMGYNFNWMPFLYPPHHLFFYSPQLSSPWTWSRSAFMLSPVGHYATVPMLFNYPQQFASQSYPYQNYPLQYNYRNLFRPQYNFKPLPFTNTEAFQVKNLDEPNENDN